MAAGSTGSRLGADGFGQRDGGSVGKGTRAALDAEADGGAILAVDDDVGERRHAGYLDADGRKEPPRYGDGFDGLVDGAGPDGLDLDGRAVLDHAGDSARYRCGGRLGGYLEAPDLGSGVVRRHVVLRLRCSLVAAIQVRCCAASGGPAL